MELELLRTILLYIVLGREGAQDVLYVYQEIKHGLKIPFYWVLQIQQRREMREGVGNPQDGGCGR